MEKIKTTFCSWRRIDLPYVLTPWSIYSHLKLRQLEWLNCFITLPASVFPGSSSACQQIAPPGDQRVHISISQSFRIFTLFAPIYYLFIWHRGCFRYATSKLLHVIKIAFMAVLDLNINQSSIWRMMFKNGLPHPGLYLPTPYKYTQSVHYGLSP